MPGRVTIAEHCKCISVHRSIVTHIGLVTSTGHTDIAVVGLGLVVPGLNPTDGSRKWKWEQPQVKAEERTLGP